MLDDLAEFPPSALDALRQPLMNTSSEIARTATNATLPARFLLAATRQPGARAATTLNIYSHFVEAGDQDAAKMLGQLIQTTETTTKDGQEMGSEAPELERPHQEDGA